MSQSNEPGPSPGTASVDVERLVSLRWVSALAMVLVVLAAPAFGIELARAPLLTIAVALAGINVGWRGRPPPPAGRGAPPLAHLGVDLLAWGTYLYFSGGATNPLISLLLPLVAIGAAILPPWQAWTLGGIAMAAYTALWSFHRPLVIHDPRTTIHLHLLGMWATFMVSVGVAVWFITRMTRTLRELDGALADARAAARETALRDDWLVSLGSLAAGAAHELSTPLATLHVLAGELLAEPDLPATVRADLKTMRAQTLTCKRALARLTTRAGHARAGELATQAAEDWLRDQAAVWQTLHPQAEIVLDADASLRDIALGPDATVEQALHNLVNNAIAASRHSVQVSARVDAGFLVICIADSGTGIPASVLARLGQPQPVPSAGGLGIGLQLAQGTIERHGGTLVFASTADGGTAVSVRLPLARLRPS